MINLNDRGSEGSFNSSFLPEDYLREKSEKRMNLLCLVLFAVVMFGVVAAFFVTNREAKTIQTLQSQVSKAYAAEQAKIKQLKELDEQKAAMLEKAEITTALLERVPRSVLFAELINRMPEKLTLTDFDLEGDRRKAMAAQASNPKQRGKSLVKGKGGQDAEADKKPTVLPPPVLDFELNIQGLAGSDEEVADFHRSLKACELLEDVDLISARDVLVDDVVLREFKIEARIRPDADARHIEPLKIPRGKVARLPTAPGAGRMTERALNEQGLGDRQLRDKAEANEVTGVDTNK